MEDKRRALKTGTPYRDEGWVFATHDGGMLNPANVEREYANIRKRARLKDRNGKPTVELPALPLHALRHTAVSLLLAAGAPLEIISKMIGHKNCSLTLQTYSHMLPETSKRAADALDAFLADRFKTAAKPAK